MEKIPQMTAAEREPSLDSKWFSTLEVCLFEDYEKLAGNKEVRAERKNAFLQDKVVNPELDYPKLETFDIELRERELLALKERVLAEEQNEVVKKIYRTKINEYLAQLRMLKATKAGDDRKFSRYSDFIYGKPQAQDASYIGSSILKKIESTSNSFTEEQCEAAKRLHLVLEKLAGAAPSNYEGVDTSVLPSPNESIPDELIENIDTVEEMMTMALASYGLDDWKVIIDTESGLKNLRVSQENKTVVLPEEESLKKRRLTYRKLQGLIAHEIGVHAVRRNNGERSKLQLLGIGLDRYIKGEEGVATYEQQKIEGAEEFAGIPRYFSIVLAKGLDGGGMRDFREVYNIMKDYRLVTGATANSEKAAETAYNDCVRIFRGSSCRTAGAVYAKDMAYFGNREIWNLVHEDSDVVHTFKIGKFDPANPEHVAVLSQLGILDSDLEHLDS